MRNVPCPNCGSEDRKTVHTVADLNWKQAGTFTIVRCGSCGTVYLSPAPTLEEYAGIYPPEYYSHAGLVSEPSEKDKRYFERGFIDRSKTLESFRKPGKILDVGSNRGFMLARLKSRGWDTWGAEISAPACDYAVNALGLDKEKIYCGDFLSMDIPEGGFDMITLFDVLEHMENPRAVLEKCRKLLKPGGGIFLQVPNYNSAGRLLFGKYWIHLDAPRHLTHFTTSSLKGFMRGWEVVSVRTGTSLNVKYISGYSDSLRYWIRGLRRGADAPKPKPAERPSGAAPASHNPLVGVERAATKAAAAVLSAAGLGEWIQLYARKK